MKYKLNNYYNSDISKYTPFSIPCDSGKDLNSDIKGNIRIAQELHHAMHVLLFFQILVQRTLNGERIRRSILGRIIHHLMDLREFLEDGMLNDQVNILLASVQREYDDSLWCLTRRIHRMIKTVAGVFDHGENQRFLSTVTTVLIVWSEHEKNPKICMYPWLVANQAKILEFADHYGKKDIFKNVLPIGKKIIDGGLK